MSDDFDSRAMRAWVRFQARLADHLAEMKEDDLLLLEVESSLGDEHGDEQGAAPYVQFCAWEGERLRCEAVSNTYLAEAHRLDDAATTAIRGLGFSAPTHGADEVPDGGSANFWVDVQRDEADRLAVMAVRALRNVYGVLHPAFLAGLPDPAEAAPAPAGFCPDEEPAVYPTDGREHLQRLVDEALTPFFGHAPHHDDDGDIPVECGDVVAFVRVLTDRPVVRVFACVASDLDDLARAAFEIGVLNRDRLFFKFLLLGDAIVMHADVPAWPFAPAHVRDLVDQLCRSVGEIHDDLAGRLGASSGSAVDKQDDAGRIHPAMLTLLQLDADEPGSVDASLAASICEHDRDLILELLALNEEQQESAVELDPGVRITKVLRGALRVTVLREARVASRAPRKRGRHDARRRRVPDPTLEEVDPDMWS